jgi:tetratricopeptide (TPR) repeat protein
MLAGGPSWAAGVPRTVPTVAEIVTAKGDELVQFVDDPRWRAAVIEQDLATGDTLRTGPYGALALLFRDDTQLRVHRNTLLVVKGLRGRAGAAATELRLERGAAWTRARSIPAGLRMETPAVTAAIRGTDWYVKVEDDGRTTVIVLDGEVRLENKQGVVTLTRGEIGVVEVGMAPTKAVLLSPRDRPQWELAITPEWALTLNVSGLTPTALRAAERRLQEALARSRTSGVLVSAAEVAYELEDVAGARALLTEARAALGPPGSDLDRRATVLHGLLLAREYRWDEALAVLDAVRPALSGRSRSIAGLGRFVAHLGQRRYADAERILAELEREDPGSVDVQVADVQLASLRGDHAEARARARRAAERFTRDSRFHVWLSHIALLLDEPEEMRMAFEVAIALDDEQYLGWQLKATYHQQVRGDPAGAMAALRRVQEIAPRYAAAWNSLGRLRGDLGDYDGALAAVREAIRLAPNDALYRAGLATLLIVYLDRIDAGLGVAQAALALDPAEPTALRATAFAALKEGRSDEAIEGMLRATAVNPGLGSATTELAVAYYQAEQFDAATQAIANAIRLDPNDPVGPLVGSVMAVDQAQAGRAIRLAREALDRALRHEGAYGENLAKSQSGILNVGTAYGLLGLDDWGLYYGQLSFTPETALGHLFLANRYATASARRAEVVQGLLFDPLAVSTRARYFDFVRRPFHDVTLGASLGTRETALTDTQSVIVQGFVRDPLPLAYFVGVQRASDAGFRENSGTRVGRTDLGLGVKPGPDEDWLASFVALRSRAGVPGHEDDPDPDDRSRLDRVEGTVGYHRRLEADSHVLARLTAGYIRDRFDNDRPLGSGLSALSNSLVRTFGVDTTRALYATGLRDGGILGPGLFGGSPIFLTPGNVCPTCPIAPNDLPERIDLKPFASFETEELSVLLQARHLLRIGAGRLTYGAEWRHAHVDDVVRATTLAPEGTGMGVLAPDGGTFTTFPFGGIALDRDADTRQPRAGFAYLDGGWMATPDLRLEGGLAVRHFDDDAGTEETRVDPRAGIAWQLGTRHWLRAAGQRSLALPIDGTLAPVGTVGLLAREDLVLRGGSATSWQGRWDGEWSPRAFTFVAAERQRLERFVAGVPQSLGAFVVDKGRLDSIAIGTNVWLSEGWGVFARQRWTWTENLTKAPGRGEELPLVPRRGTDVGVTWVHPVQLRVSVFATYVGPRQGDVLGDTTLESYWTTGAVASWQPARKRWALTLRMDNLLDERHELAPGIPTPGFSASLAAEYRFDVGGRR